mgnify:CR=1 FL=1
MKKSDLKKLIKPLVKECMQEALIEEGLLSDVISEVVKGLGAGSIIRESQARSAPTTTPIAQNSRVQEIRQQMEEDKRKLISSFKQETINGVNVFEGTEPLSNYEASSWRLVGYLPKRLRCRYLRYYGFGWKKLESFN